MMNDKLNSVAEKILVILVKDFSDAANNLYPSFKSAFFYLFSYAKSTLKYDIPTSAIHNRVNFEVNFYSNF